jgi:LysM repeat protein
MNTPNPLIPQGTLPPKGKSSFLIKVLMIVAVHVLVIGGMLLQGCKDTKDTADTAPTNGQSSADTNTTPVLTGPSNPPVSVTPPTGPGVAPVAPVAPITPPIAPVAPVAPPTTGPGAGPTPTAAPATAETKEYVIVQGDTLGAIAKKNGISLKALLDANTGVNPKKLHAGQKIQIPGGTGGLASSPSMSATDTGTSGETAIYTVKTGDTLSKIAKAHGTSYKKLIALNNLKSTSIKTGQKLKLPAPKASATEAASATPVPAAVSPAPAPVAPVGVAPVAAPVTGTSAPAAPGNP